MGTIDTDYFVGICEHPAGRGVSCGRESINIEVHLRLQPPDTPVCSDIVGNGHPSICKFNALVGGG